MKVRGLRTAMRRHVQAAVARLDPARYHQEPAYVAALFAKLDDVVIDRPGTRVELRSTIVADRGPKSAESIWGADFGLTVSLMDQHYEFDKAVLGQAKRGSLSTIESADENLRKQVIKMAAATTALVGLEVPTSKDMMPVVRILEPTLEYGQTWAAKSSTSALELVEHVLRPSKEGPSVLVGPTIPLDEYLCDYLVGCPHGDRRKPFVQALEHSKLPLLRIYARKG